jgi:hypothetical protein
VLHAENKVGRLLRLRLGLHNQLFVILQRLKPVLNIGRGVLKGALGIPGMTAKECRAHFRNQLLLAIQYGFEP